MTRPPAPKATDPGQPAAGQPGGNRPATADVAELRAQLREAHETIEAIRDGAVDSLVIGPAGREQVYAVATADRSYRLIFEAAQEGVATVSPRGVIIDANPRLASMTGRLATELPGTEVLDLITEAHRAAFARLLDIGAGQSARGQLELTGPGRTIVPVLLAVGGFELDGTLLRFLILTDLTAERAAEAKAASAHEALREQDALLEQAQAAVGLGWWIADLRPAGRFTASTQARHVFGMPQGEPGWKTEAFWHLVHRDDAARISDSVTAVQDGRAPFQAEHRIIRPDGSLRWVLQSAVVERDGTGAPSRMLGICLDITDRKRTEDEIRAAAAYNRSLIEASLDPLVTIGPDGAITDANTATERATGFDRAQLVGTEFSGYFTEPDLARAGYEQVFRDGSVRDYPLELRHRDGHTISVLYNASVYRDPAGQALGVFAAARDVTENKRAQAALRESEGRLRALFDNAPVGIDELTASGDLLRANPCFCAIVGYSADELRGMRLQDISHPGDLDADLAGLQRLLSGEIDTYSMDKRYLRNDGGVVWAEVNRAAVRNQDGKELRLIGVVRDVTAQHRAEAEVRALNADLEARVQQRTADLERANKNLAAFTYSVSHDLRAPLRALSGFSEALLEDCGDQLDETGRGYAGRIQAASERMATLIDDLLHLSRVSRAEMNRTPVDLSAEVASIADELQSAEPGRRVRFAIQGGVSGNADRALIRSVVQNLVENAWKFTARREDATIEFGTTTADDAGVCYFVRDNGAGFDPAYAGKLFQPFQRLHTASEFPGTGIGLASVQRIIDRHGGRAWAESAVDSGATFYFTLGTKPASEVVSEVVSGVSARKP
ncbi:MAG: PAS domain S-box protein [Streptosporangiaceae bacterium]